MPVSWMLANYFFWKCKDDLVCQHVWCDLLGRDYQDPIKENAVKTFKKTHTNTPKATSNFHTIEISTFKTKDYLIVCYYILTSVYVKRKFSCQLTMKARKLCLVCDFMAEEADKTAV